MFPQAWTILQTRHMKGCLQMRSSVLFWYRQISWRATTPAGTSGASLVPLSKILCRGPSPYSGLMQPASLLVIEGPAVNLASAWVGGSWQFPHSLQPLQLPPPPFHLSQWGTFTHKGHPQWGTPPLAHPWCYFHPCHLKWSSNQSETVVGFFEVAHGLLISLLTAILF